MDDLLQLLRSCLGDVHVDLVSAALIKNKLHRRVWNCTLARNDVKFGVILICFASGSWETSNASLPPAQTARKCVLAMSELRELGIPTPRILGYRIDSTNSALVCERVIHRPMTAATRLHGATILACLHRIERHQLSAELNQLVRESDPRPQRTMGSDFPPFADNVRNALVHGDFCSFNVLSTVQGVCIIDWETFGLGDPMWDLSFLTSGDRNIPESEVEAVLSAYGRVAALDRARWNWHHQKWKRILG